MWFKRGKYVLNKYQVLENRKKETSEKQMTLLHWKDPT